MHHENIVNYHSSWLEFNVLNKSTNDFDEEEYEHDDYSIDETRDKHKNFDDSTSASASGRNNKFFREPSHAATSFSATNENDTTTNNNNNNRLVKNSVQNDESSVFTQKSKKPKSIPYQSNNNYIFTLYIQMRLCDFTLKHYITKRNGDVHMCPIGDKNILFKENEKLYSNIFRQILSGVNYMHSKSIIHRDLKVKKKFSK